MLDFSNQSFYLLGYSGHSYVIIETIKSLNGKIIGYFDNYENKSNPFNLQFLGKETIERINALQGFFFPAIGSNSIREKLTHYIDNNNLKQTYIIDHGAQIAQSVIIGLSTFIAPKAIVNSMSKIGQGCIINTGSIIEHECIIENFVHIAPGAVLAGGVIVKKGSFIGANATVIQGIEIGSNATIGAGSVVLKNVPNGETWVGVPAKRI